MIVPLEDIRLGPNVPAGMSAKKAMHYAYLMSTTAGWPDGLAPIQVRRNGDAWQLVDGRHRLIAAMIAGRANVEAQAQTPPERKADF